MDLVERETHTEMVQKIYFQQSFETQQKGDEVGGWRIAKPYWKQDFPLTVIKLC